MTAPGALADRRAVLRELCAIAERAGAVIREVYATDFAVESKGPNDPVTIADKRANALVCEALARAYPGVPVVAEESAAGDYAGFERADAAFFVDPLDGTREFVAKNGEFVVMIGLAEAGRSVLGVVHAPASGVTWSGAVGVGAFRGETPITVVDPGSLAASRVVVSRSRVGARLTALLDRTPPREVRPLGSAGLKGIAVASGEADVYVQLGSAGSLWDACAPEAIVLAAGGRFSDESGAPIDYRASDVKLTRGVVAAGPTTHAATLAAIRA